MLFYPEKDFIYQRKIVREYRPFIVGEACFVWNFTTILRKGKLWPPTSKVKFRIYETVFKRRSVCRKWHQKYFDAGVFIIPHVAMTLQPILTFLWRTIMSWKQNITTFLTDALRLSIRACFFLDGILLALFSIWFCVKFLSQTIDWLNRSIFNTPW